MTSPGSGSGYWLVASDGGVFSYGVSFYGSGVASALPPAEDDVAHASAVLSARALAHR